MVSNIEVVRSFRAMNTAVEAIVCAAESAKAEAEFALGEIERLFLSVELQLSRFNPASELSHLNSRRGRAFKATPMLFDVVSLAKNAARLTEGIFDPTILPALIDAGYDRSFEELVESRGFTPRVALENRVPGWQAIELDPGTESITLPAGTQLDLGGIGKGWTVDRACSYLKAFDGFAVDAGGDIRVGGCGADGTAWTVGVEDPLQHNCDLTILSLCQGAVCTSTTTHRSWSLNGERKHHLIDPRSGAPAESGVASVTIIADSAVRAEIAAKTALILGAEAGMAYIEGQVGLDGLIVLDSGRLLRSAGIKELESVA